MVRNATDDDQEPVPYPVVEGLIWRALTLDDVPALGVLLETIRLHDEGDHPLTDDDLRAEMSLSWVDLARDTVVATNGTGEFRAWGTAMHRPGAEERVNIGLPGGVHPELRGRGVGRRLLEWQRRRAEQMVGEIRSGGGPEASLPARCSAGAREDQTDARELFEYAGMQPDRWFIDMRRPLDTLPEEPLHVGPGLRIDPWSEKWSQATREAHNEAFRDHWGSEPIDDEAWSHTVVQSARFRPRLSFLAIDEKTDDVAGYALNAEFPQLWEEQGFSEGYTSILGVRRAWRGHGIARALLDASGRAFRDAGHAYAGLDVDAESLTGAVRLYTGVGYEVQRRNVMYGLVFDAASS